ncbi:MAG: transposase, partial [Bradyrhizobium sp.]|nr:transposase [Bradyrhizobium sp.]
MNFLAGFADISLLQLLLVASVALFASIIGGLAGYGTGALMPLVLVPMVGAEPVVPIIAISAILTNLSRVVAYISHADRTRAGIVIAAALAIVAGDDPERIRSEAAFAKLCGACPLPASSGRTNRHRLNKGGNRQGDMALRRIAIVRLRYHQPTRDHAAGKTREGEGRLENIRCVKRFIAREACRVLIAIRNGGIGRRMPAERGAGLREPRVGHGITHSRST